jgi:hypothetical protein
MEIGHVRPRAGARRGMHGSAVFCGRKTLAKSAGPRRADRCEQPRPREAGWGDLKFSVRVTMAGGQRFSATKRGETETRGAAPGRPLSTRPAAPTSGWYPPRRTRFALSVRVSLSALALHRSIFGSAIQRYSAWITMESEASQKNKQRTAYQTMVLFCW